MNTDIENQRHYIETIKNNISNTLKMTGINTEVTITNNGRAICASGITDELYIWIRLYPTENNKYIVDISNIQFPQDKRRQGIFTILMKRLTACKYVKTVRIISVSTQEMLNWVTKHRAKEIGYYNYEISRYSANYTG